MLDTKYKKPKHKPVHQAGYVALSGMIVGSSHKQVHLQHNMNVALLTSQHQLCWDSLLGWIYQVPEQATLSNQHLQFQIFSRQCAELHLQLLVQYLVKSNKMKNKKLKNTRYNTNSYSSGTVFSGWAHSCSSNHLKKNYFFLLRTSIHIGNGRHTRFWWDIWAGNSKLKDLFPTLFRIAAHKSTSMADLWGTQGGEDGCWEVHFRRSFQDWELEKVTRFLEHISAIKVQEGEDSLAWKNDGRWKFNVKSYYKSLRAENSFLFPAKEIWGSYVPFRTRFFCIGSSLG